MEIELQNEAPEVERELPPQEVLRGLWSQQSGMPFLRQKNTIQMRPDLISYAGLAGLRGWASPRAFALQGLAVAAVLLSMINWYATHDAGPARDQIEALHNDFQAETNRQTGIMDAIEAERKRIVHSPATLVWKSLSKEETLQQMNASLEDSKKSLQQFKDKVTAKEKEIHAGQQAEALADSGTPIIFSLALVFAAGWVAAGLRRDFPRSNVRAAGDLYLYFAAADGIWLNLAFVVLLHFALSGSWYGFSTSLGPLFWVVFWIAFYVLFVRYLVVVSRDMYKALQIRPPANEWDLENKMLMRLNNSFLIVFAALEAMFLSLAYLYHAALLRFS